MDKKTLRKFDIRIQSLSNNKHNFSFDFNQELFDNYSKELDFFDSKGNCEIELIKTEMMLDFTFIIDGEVYLKCDRTLKKFKYEMNTSKKILFKFGDKDEEISDEMTNEVTIAKHNIDEHPNQQLIFYLLYYFPVNS